MISEEWDDWIEDGPSCPGLFDPSVVCETAERCWEDAKDRGFDIVKIRKEWSKRTAYFTSHPCRTQ